MGSRRLFWQLCISHALVGLFCLFVAEQFDDSLVAAAALALAVGGVGAWLATNRIEAPLAELKAGAQRLAEGDLSSRLAPSEDVGGVAEALNEMAARLNRRIRDITQDRNQQEAILASMSEGVLAVDEHERLLSLNRAAGAMLGLDPDGAAGRTIREVVRHPGLQRFVDRALASDGTVEQDLTFRDDGDERMLQARGTALLSMTGKNRRIGAVIVLNDVTRIRRLETLRRDFVANVSHELKTPITSIKGFVETLQDGAIEERKEAARFLGIIARHADRLTAIIEDLLLLSRIEQERENGKLALQVLPVASAVGAAAQACEIRASERQIEIRVDCPPDLEARINRQLLEQALTNLIDNAIKYTDARDTSIEVSAQRETGGGVAIRVRDHGRGIAAHHIPRLFERFYRVDKGRSRAQGGTGLGLAIVKHIVQTHRGRIDVQSAPGQGSTFAIHLPDPARPAGRVAALSPHRSGQGPNSVS
jgi:two-component system phosphate regulon sensor histidine kinase PhoR